MGHHSVSLQGRREQGKPKSRISSFKNQDHLFHFEVKEMEVQGHSLLFLPLQASGVVLCYCLSQAGREILQHNPLRQKRD